ncbi:MAG: enoyl-CoA hydratase [Betaproteobacteria bacterium RIFCSPLOWO2_12_FULL_65_14]|nr:MAG: enoyl-CoA hydratase [Betaproteobacteria bacterium RIFCSPLOWO2_12_FULL_65_14]
MTTELLHEVRDGVAYVTFNRPQARNALTFAMYERLAEICNGANQDRSIRAILITGAGDKAFAAGTDISQFRAFDKAQDALDYEARIDRVMTAIERCRVPTIAAIHGACTGGGASIAACCDLRIASRDMKYGFPVARTLGNCLSLVSYARLVYLVGPSLVKDIVFRARLVEADEALARGLVMELTENQETLMQRAGEIARQVASHAPLTLQATKEALLRLRPEVKHGEGNDLVLMCYMSEDFREGMDAFLNKRKPAWKGR